ncbi:hypothetical protein AVEN_46138-1 [Araneus ventricosus]|uniref:Tc1-like transposase DDE domain-containing protein n=1 Tax=Araneus ventricosus TaxID=182803 RepID=A0A4Y2D9H2_ARAVE|nr:hypothetical protein AVEN_46138-1 [Araneus ventricosus]
MWFHHDRAPAHFSTDVRNYLNATFGARWIGSGGLVPWPPRSPDLSSLDYFLWRHLKSLVYATSVDQMRISLLEYPRLMHVCVKYLVSM